MVQVQVRKTLIGVNGLENMKNANNIDSFLIQKLHIKLYECTQML